LDAHPLVACAVTKLFSRGVGGITQLLGHKLLGHNEIDVYQEVFGSQEMEKNSPFFTCPLEVMALTFMDCMLPKLNSCREHFKWTQRHSYLCF
jgi:hypothetical protein